MVVLAGMYIAIFRTRATACHHIVGVSLRGGRDGVAGPDGARDPKRAPGIAAVRWEAGLSLGLIVATFVGAPTLAWASGKLREHPLAVQSVMWMGRRARVPGAGRPAPMMTRPACEACGMAWAWPFRWPHRMA